MNTIQRINTTSLRTPTKSYSNGVFLPLGSFDLMFITGQLSQDIDGKVVSPNNPKEQTLHIFHRISNILAEVGMTIDDVVKVQIFVTNIDAAADITKVRDEVLKISRPASTLVEVSALGKKDCCVEIEVTAARIKN
jgi:enamine deaminase RidA (YjgF/YER057c/UK114 family)